MDLQKMCPRKWPTQLELQCYCLVRHYNYWFLSPHCPANRNCLPNQISWCNIGSWNFIYTIFAVILVPTLAWMLRFNKRTNPTMWKNIGKFPVKAFIPIVLIFGSVTFIGIANLEYMNEPITGSSEAPDGIDSLDSLAEYSEYFSGGQTLIIHFQC